MCVAVFFLQSAWFWPASVSIGMIPMCFGIRISSPSSNLVSVLEGKMIHRLDKNPYVCKLGRTLRRYHWAYSGRFPLSAIYEPPHQSQNPDRKSEQFEKFRVFVLKIPLTVHTLLRAPAMPFECQETVPFIHQKRQWHSDRQTIFSPMPMVLSRSISYIKCKRFYSRRAGVLHFRCLQRTQQSV